MSKELLTIDETARALKVKKSWLYGKTRLKGEDQIPTVRVGKYIRINLEELLTWLKKKQEKKQEC